MPNSFVETDAAEHGAEVSLGEEGLFIVCIDDTVEIIVYKHYLTFRKEAIY